MKQVMRCDNTIDRRGGQARQALCLCVLSLFCALCLSCENKWPRNGDLDGQWQLLTIERGDTTIDVKSYGRYLSFQLDLFQLTTNNTRQCYYGYFDHTGGQITFRQFSDMAENDLATQDNLPLTEADLVKLHPWGYYRLNETFRVERLNGQEMQLRSDSARITYRKF